MGYNRPSYFTIQAQYNNNSPGDSETRYWGNTLNVLYSGANMEIRMYAPFSCTIEKVYFTWRNVTQDCTAEDVNLYIDKNSGTTTTLYTGSMANSQSPKLCDANVQLNAGDYFTLKYVTPAWVTNPTGQYLAATIYLRI